MCAGRERKACSRNGQSHCSILIIKSGRGNRRGEPIQTIGSHGSGVLSSGKRSNPTDRRPRKIVAVLRSHKARRPGSWGGNNFDGTLSRESHSAGYTRTGTDLKGYLRTVSGRKRPRLAKTSWIRLLRAVDEDSQGELLSGRKYRRGRYLRKPKRALDTAQFGYVWSRSVRVVDVSFVQNHLHPRLLHITVRHPCLSLL